MTQWILKWYRRLQRYLKERVIGISLSQHRLWLLRQQTDGKQADFSGEDLSSYTSLMMADLRWANLSRAKLKLLFKTDLTHANLIDADLREGLLIETNLSGARLDGVDFTGATFGRTILADVNLANCKGLDTVTHSLPSSI